ncbi:hypothetical protein SBRCBS47491_006067 [Sporothrix bragantina]|uniref:NAD(P)-binding protein n=1 Tax=Sporothrix bragantina TaxID=671064 RepID=A0ABP0C3Z6_9PEZI
MSGKVALVTGGCSGMGLAVSRHLAKQGWKISVVDLNESAGVHTAEELGGIFSKANVAKHEDMAAAFQKTRETYGRIDFVYANAGIVDTYNFYEKHDTLPPPPLPLVCQDVCLLGVEVTSYLAMHYMRQNPTPGGVIVMTSSAAGIYASPALPIYTAAKFGVVGLMRAMGPMLAKENIRVNCTLPGVVRTNLCDEETWKGFPSEQFTTVENIAAAIQKILDDETIVGKAVEVSQGNIYYREQHEYCDEVQAITMGAASANSY